MLRVVSAICFSMTSLSLYGVPSALAPSPERVTDCGAAQESVLAILESRCRSVASFSFTAHWEVEKGFVLEEGEHVKDMSSFCRTPNWSNPKGEAGFQPRGVIDVIGQGDGVKFTRPGAEDDPGDWWIKRGKHFYGSRFVERSPYVWRFWTDLFEADYIGYAEGLGLALWAFDPSEYLRRAGTLNVGTPVMLNGKSYETLVAVPKWFDEAPYLPASRVYRFSLWANQIPKITYFYDAKTGLIERARFEYVVAEPVSAGDEQRVEPTPSGVAIECWVTATAVTADGYVYPLEVRGEMTERGVAKRSMRWTVENVVVNPSVASGALGIALPANKLVHDPWLRQSQVYERELVGEPENPANYIGLARALAFEGRAAEAKAKVGVALVRIEAIPDLQEETKVHLSWSLGEALYEILDATALENLQGFWDGVAGDETVTGLAYSGAVVRYARLRASERDTVEELLRQFSQVFPGAYSRDDLGAWVHLTVAQNRALDRERETDLDRIVDIKAVYNEAISDRIRLACVSEGVGIYFRLKLFEEGLAFIEEVGDRVVTTESRDALYQLKQDWQAEALAGEAALQADVAVAAHAAQEAHLDELVRRKEEAAKAGDSEQASYYDKLVTSVMGQD